MTKKSRKRTLRIVLLVGTVVSLFFVPWLLVKAWILPLPNTVQGQVDETIEHRMHSEISYKSTYADKHINDDRFIFFLHNRFLEEHELNESHPEFGRTEYHGILKEFEKSGFKVISEKRDGNVNAREYAIEIVNQIDSLLKSGIDPKKITVVGTSKGGYIAQYVSTLANNLDLNFVFVASFRESDLEMIPDINFCGNILTIYEKTDPYGVSAVGRKDISSCDIRNFREIELDTEMGHGFLFKPLDEWIEPTIQWASGNYGFE